MTVSDATLRRLAWTAWWFFAAMCVLAAVLSAFDGSASSTGADLAFLVVVSAFPLTGLLILRRHPRNTIGWLLVGIGCVWGLGGLGDNYARFALLVNPGSLPGPALGATVSSNIWAPALGLMGTFLILLYPDGHLPSPRWRPVAWLSAATVLTLTVVLYLTPGELVDAPTSDLTNPLALESAQPVLEAALVVLLPLFAACFVACAVGLVRRFRRSRGVERQQLKWLATAGAVVASVFLVGIVTSAVAAPAGREPTWMVVLDHVVFLLWALLPVSIGIAILRHGLYSIDVVINRALVYGSLTAALAGVYLGSVLLLQLLLSPLTEQSDLAVAGSTLAVAALFGPARAQIQGLVDRRFYRQRYDATLALDAFAGRLRDEVDLEAVGHDLRATVQQTVQPTHVSLWLRSTP
jgi:hypothetical protein